MAFHGNLAFVLSRASALRLVCSTTLSYLPAPFVNGAIRFLGRLAGSCFSPSVVLTPSKACDWLTAPATSIPRSRPSCVAVRHHLAHAGRDRCVLTSRSGCWLWPGPPTPARGPSGRSSPGEGGGGRGRCARSRGLLPPSSASTLGAYLRARRRDAIVFTAGVGEQDAMRGAPLIARASSAGDPRSTLSQAVLASSPSSPLRNSRPSRVL